MRPAALLTALLLAGCTCEPEFVDCSVRCGVGNKCQEGLECTSGFCRQKGATGTCTCRPGETRPCGSSVGECAAGSETCQQDRTWGACVGEGIPTFETCDGKDNDCNGTVDDNPADAPACTRRLGVCAGKRLGCTNGQYQGPCSAADYGPDYQAVETRCDGLDNDCDGRTDVTAPRRLSDAGLWVLLGFDGGYGLVSALPDVTGWMMTGQLYDATLAPSGGVVTLATGPGIPSGLSAVASGDRAVVSWLVESAPAQPLLPDAVEWTRIAPLAPTRLVGLPPAGDRGTGSFVAGLPAAGIVAAHLLDDGGAALLSWTSSALPPSATPFSAPGVALSRIDGLLVSRGGSTAVWRGAGLGDGGAPVDGGTVALVGGRTSLARPQGQPMERGGALEAAWAESVLQGAPSPRDESAIRVMYDVWDGGSFAVRVIPDYRAITAFAATQGPTAPFLAWAEFSTLWVGTPAGASTLRALQPLDGGVGAVGVANAGTQWNVVGWNASNGMNAMLICAP